MLSTPKPRRFSTTTALIVGSLLAGGLTAVVTDSASAAVRTAGTTIAATTPTPTRTPTQPTGPASIAIPKDTTPDPPAPAPSVGPNGLAGEAPLSLAKMTSSIDAALAVNGGPTGWSYSISKGGQDVGGKSGGFARRPNDNNNIPGGIGFTQGTRIQLMSVTKSITAIAIVRALDAADVDVDTPVSSYLPGSWVKGKGFAANSVKPVTFRHLLTHTSGVLQEFEDEGNDISTWGNRWDSLQPLVANGSTPNEDAGEQYKNANYALLRVLLPKLWSLADGPAGAVTEGNHGLRWLSYVNTRILAPAGVNDASCSDTNDHANTHAYNRTNLLVAGAPLGYADDAINECGGHAGLILSSRDLVKVTAKLRESTAIMPAAARTEMFAGRLGWSTDSNRADKGSLNVWYHAGDGFYLQGRELHTCVMNAPQQYQLSLVMNSGRPSGKRQCDILLDAVNAARAS